MHSSMERYMNDAFVIKGLGGARESSNLRAGLAFVIAAVVAKGESVIHNVNTTIDRGYENIVERLRGVGVEIERVRETDL